MAKELAQNSPGVGQGIGLLAHQRKLRIGGHPVSEGVEIGRIGDDRHGGGSKRNLRLNCNIFYLSPTAKTNRNPNAGLFRRLRNLRPGPPGL
jgi:hypothetical protein